MPGSSQTLPAHTQMEPPTAKPPKLCLENPLLQDSSRVRISYYSVSPSFTFNANAGPVTGNHRKEIALQIGKTWSFV